MLRETAPKHRSSRARHHPRGRTEAASRGPDLSAPAGPQRRRSAKKRQCQKQRCRDDGYVQTTGRIAAPGRRARYRRRTAGQRSAAIICRPRPKRAPLFKFRSTRTLASLAHGAQERSACAGGETPSRNCCRAQGFPAVAISQPGCRRRQNKPQDIEQAECECDQVQAHDDALLRCPGDSTYEKYEISYGNCQFHI
jgi:hypothetical protein